MRDIDFDRYKKNTGKLTEQLNLSVDVALKERLDRLKDRADVNKWVRDVLITRLPELERACMCMDGESSEMETA